MDEVRALIDDKGHKVKEATPSTPVGVVGSDVAPSFNLVEISMANTTDVMKVKLVGESKVLLAENDDNLIAENGDFYYTEGE